MTDIVERLRAVDHSCVEDCFTQSPLFSEAADEIDRLRNTFWLFVAVENECTVPGRAPPRCTGIDDAKCGCAIEVRKALEDLCDDEGCPHFGTPHVCVSKESRDE